MYATFQSEATMHTFWNIWLRNRQPLNPYLYWVHKRAGSWRLKAYLWSFGELLGTLTQEGKVGDATSYPQIKREKLQIQHQGLNVSLCFAESLLSVRFVGFAGKLNTLSHK